MEGKSGEGKWERERMGKGKVGSDCAVLKIPLKNPRPQPSLTLRQIDAPECVISLQQRKTESPDTVRWAKYWLKTFDGANLMYANFVDKNRCTYCSLPNLHMAANVCKLQKSVDCIQTQLRHCIHQVHQGGHQ